MANTEKSQHENSSNFVEEQALTFHNDAGKTCAAGVSQACLPCKRDKIHVSGEMYCYECSELLCNECVKHHKRNKFTRNHTLFDTKENNYNTEKVEFVNGLTKCTQHSSEEVKYICKDHDQLCCNECAIVSHRQCRNLLSIVDEVAADGNHKSLQENVEKICNHATDLLNHELSQYSALDKSEGRVKDKLSSIKIQIDEAYQIFEKNVSSQCYMEGERMRQRINVQSRNLQTFIGDLKVCKDNVLTVSEFGQDLHMYLLERKIKHELEQYISQLKQLHQSSNCSELSLTETQHATDTVFKSLTMSLSIQKESKSPLPALPFFNLQKKMPDDVRPSVNKQRKSPVLPRRSKSKMERHKAVYVHGWTGDQANNDFYD